jgi:hypothetical protein
MNERNHKGLTKEGKWVYGCDECGAAEDTDAECILEVFAGEPEFCPISGDVMDAGEWRKITDEKTNHSSEQARQGVGPADSDK